MDYPQIPKDRCTGKTTRICMSIINEAMQNPKQYVTIRDHMVVHNNFSYIRCLRSNTRPAIQNMIDKLGLIGFSWSMDLDGIPKLKYTPPTQEELLELIYNK